MNDTGIDGYRVYLQRRDGEADLLNRRLASREELFEGLEADPVRSAHSHRPTCLHAEPAPPPARARRGPQDALSFWPPPN